MMLAVALAIAFQSTPLPAQSAVPSPVATAAPAEPMPDCISYDDDGQQCSSGSKQPAVSACVRGAQYMERCAQQTTGITHYAALMRAGSFWAVSAFWLGHRTPRGHAYMDNARRILVQLAHDPNAPGSISDASRRLVIHLWGTDHPTSSTPFSIDR